MDIQSYSGITRKLVSVVLAVFSFFSSTFGYASIPYKDDIDMSQYELAWQDEFDGSVLDVTKWGVHGGGWNTVDLLGTIVRKGSYWNVGLCSVEDGALHIATKYYENGLLGNGKPGWYCCGIDTSKSFKSSYGYYECRCILPKGTGLWSAFWMMSGNVGNVDGTGIDGAELDIYESANYHDSKCRNAVSSAIHYDGYGEAHESKTVHKTKVVKNDPYEDFNTYGMAWTEDEYIFYINGVEVGRTDFGGVCKEKGYMILSVEVGGENAIPADCWAGDCIDTNTEAPTDFVVDYVRYYKPVA